ncbi:MAG: hypothetical protein N3D10_02220 [Candidatus Micrarchaeota archaeon]|nr:hypothetical protein [Candidatus Micrarchaeota archaeon]
MLKLDIRDLENALNKKEKNISDVVKRLTKLNKERDQILNYSASLFINAVTGRPFLKKYATLALGQIFLSLHAYVFYLFPKNLAELEKEVSNSNFQKAQKIYSDMAEQETEFSKLFLRFLLYYDLVVLFAAAHHFYRKNNSLLTHFIKRIEDQYLVNRFSLMTEEELFNLKPKLESLAAEYLEKAKEIEKST